MSSNLCDTISRVVLSDFYYQKIHNCKNIQFLEYSLASALVCPDLFYLVLK